MKCFDCKAFNILNIWNEQNTRGEGGVRYGTIAHGVKLLTLWNHFLTIHIPVDYSKKVSSLRQYYYLVIPLKFDIVFWLNTQQPHKVPEKRHLIKNLKKKVNVIFMQMCLWHPWHRQSSLLERRSNVFCVAAMSLLIFDQIKTKIMSSGSFCCMINFSTGRKTKNVIKANAVTVQRKTDFSARKDWSFQKLNE